jgi:hypothetical protein
LLNHNRDIGLLAGERLLVLGLMRANQFYEGNPKKGEMKPLLNPDASDRELENDAAAFFQVADDLYTHERYRIDSPTAGVTVVHGE